jgi:hypothetical protein
MANIFNYHSEQAHSMFVNGKGQTKINTVDIQHGKGTKAVIIKDRRGKTVKQSRKSLTKKEVDCIRKCQFIPGLFRDCMTCIHSKRRNSRRHKSHE